MKQAEKPLPGMVVRKWTAMMPKMQMKGGLDDATEVFLDARWLRMPISDPAMWWHNLPIKWPNIMPEFGAEVNHLN